MTVRQVVCSLREKQRDLASGSLESAQVTAGSFISPLFSLAVCTFHPCARLGLGLESPSRLAMGNPPTFPSGTTTLLGNTVSTCPDRTIPP